MLHYDFSSSSQFLVPVKNHLRDNANIIREKFKDANLMKCWYQPISAFYFMIDFTQTPMFENYCDNPKDKTDHSVQICEDILNELGVVIVPATDMGMPNSARISLVLHKEAFAEAMDKLVSFFNKAH
jgi:aspartate aminotransferase